ncbi:aspartate aminotransferase family protein [Moritella viscosa]|uniref:Acetylornithine aminotransferase n=1 Tax=Moritella viscosa TaxID=80854 RepID=A0ABY1H5T8_9GAMM|nr:aspartate aminotransferase family protein [Moritella viscosa]SGY81214.1 Acetylornithine transaminase (NAcOATase and DapATase),PLP-dependent [Moritella viscosa]SGY81240.1 Acetylornithine transaminase (NAcOATase and DapATase),PLP-dependent [Moritella viscosa]SHN95802.1 Acetylornithine transaminase (NAcOATase and DapATase),PLP-dependent [Moritella viscosa]SHN95818.1 Acetylornithine transaminase (NAcOATase and DapATase),PLP-dependent [Moritella viscosa]SHN95875.1 Acetylornithine transaminase (N
MDVIREDFDNVMVPNYAPAEMIPVRGQGSRLWDQNGNEYIDFAAGIAVSCLGHCYPPLVNTLQAQSQKLWHVSNLLTNEPALRLANKLTNATFADKVFFANSGAEANEAALKLARRYAHDKFGEGKDQIIAFNQGFHGRTFFTVSVGGQSTYSDGFGPKPGAIEHVDFNDLSAFEALISDKTCAVIVEPLQGEGGIHASNQQFLIGVRALCDKYNALLIFDEVQTGVGRTGHFYAYQHTDIKPDILTSAKGLGAGFPIAAMLTTAAIADSFTVGTHGSTYGGNPLACSVAEVVVDTVNDEAFLAQVKAKSTIFQDALTEINNQYAIFSDIRGEGLLLGAELTEQYQGQAIAIMRQAAQEGLLLLVAGANVLRFTPALNIPEEDIYAGMKKLRLAIEKWLSA